MTISPENVINPRIVKKPELSLFKIREMLLEDSEIVKNMLFGPDLKKALLKNNEIKEKTYISKMRYLARDLGKKKIQNVPKKTRMAKTKCSSSKKVSKSTRVKTTTRHETRKSNFFEKTTSILSRTHSPRKLIRNSFSISPMKKKRRFSSKPEVIFL